MGTTLAKNDQKRQNSGDQLWIFQLDLREALSFAKMTPKIVDKKLIFADPGEWGVFKSQVASCYLGRFRILAKKCRLGWTFSQKPWKFTWKTLAGTGQNSRLGRILPKWHFRGTDLKLRAQTQVSTKPTPAHPKMGPTNFAKNRKSGDLALSFRAKIIPAKMRFWLISGDWGVKLKTSLFESHFRKLRPLAPKWPPFCPFWNQKVRAEVC